MVVAECMHVAAVHNMLKLFRWFVQPVKAGAYEVCFSKGLLQLNLDTLYATR